MSVICSSPASNLLATPVQRSGQGPELPLTDADCETKDAGTGDEIPDEERTTGADEGSRCAEVLVVV